MAGTDAAFMAQAIAEGERGRLAAPPNPWVGCVVVRDGVVVGAGHHLGPGTPHAEVMALDAAGERAAGATAYVTLAPCDHHGRTGPCTEALLDAGVTRVVVAVDDPDPVSGAGVERLRSAGVAADVGVATAAAGASLGPYLHHRRTGRPWCVVKTAASLDGRTAAADGTSQWITDADARADAHRLRAASQAVVVGAGTAVTDRPALTVRHGEPPREAPLRVVVDARGRVPADGPLFDHRQAPTLIVTTASADQDAVRAWKSAGAEVVEVAADEFGCDVGALLDLLGRRGVVQVLIEGGAALHGSVLRAGLADELVVYAGGAVLGDQGAPVFADLAVASIDVATRWVLADVRVVGVGARLTWRRA